ncbi:MAG: rod shape-determining protein, partial [candidate division Zixibacteria bacterium]|nr:rod shape-determining protein [candidate division Zixibacteria bacterium]
DIKAHRPLRDGVIADFEYTEEMIRYFIRKVLKNPFLIRPNVVACIPSGITGVEKRAVRDAAERAGAKDVLLIAEPMAAAIGCSLPVEEPIGSMIIDIGGGTSEIAVISLGGIVTSKSSRTGGDEMDEAIIQHLRKTYNLQIGVRMSEHIKWQLGSAYPGLEEEKEMSVKGIDLVGATPRAITVNSGEIRESLSQPLNEIITAVRQTLEVTPPELAADIIDQGIVMSGGGSRLRGLDRRIMAETNLPVRLDDDPMTCVVRGTGKIIENFPAYEKMLEILKD